MTRSDTWTGTRTDLQFLRFLAAGLLNAAFGYTVFVLMIWIHAPAFAALVGSTAAGILFNFQTSRLIVFQSREPGRGWHFAAVYAGVFALDWSALSFLHTFGVAPWAAQAILVAPLALFSFVAQKLIVWRQPCQTAPHKTVPKQALQPD